MVHYLHHLAVVSNLQFLNLRANRITAIPKEMEDMKNLTTLLLELNDISSLPTLSFSNLTSFMISDNSLTFEHIIPNLNAAQFFIYAPQDSIGRDIDTVITFGDPITMSVILGRGDNVYQWSKNRVDIAGAVSSSFTIQNIQAEHSGVYLCKVTNPLAPEFDLVF